MPLSIRSRPDRLRKLPCLAPGLHESRSGFPQALLARSRPTPDTRKKRDPAREALNRRLAYSLLGQSTPGALRREFTDEQETSWFCAELTPPRQVAFTGCWFGVVGRPVQGVVPNTQRKSSSPWLDGRTGLCESRVPCARSRSPGQARRQDRDERQDRKQRALRSQ